MKVIEFEKFNDLPDRGELEVMYRVKELDMYIGQGFYEWRSDGCYVLKQE